MNLNKRKILVIFSASATFLLIGFANAQVPPGYSCGEGLEGNYLEYNHDGHYVEGVRTPPPRSYFSSMPPLETAIGVPNFSAIETQPPLNPPFDKATTGFWFMDQWTGGFMPPKDGEYAFTITGDDGMRIWVSDSPIDLIDPGPPNPVHSQGDQTNLVDSWVVQSVTAYQTDPIPLKGGRMAYLLYEHFQSWGPYSSKIAVNGVPVSAADLCFLKPLPSNAATGSIGLKDQFVRRNKIASLEVSADESVGNIKGVQFYMALDKPSQLTAPPLEIELDGVTPGNLFSNPSVLTEPNPSGGASVIVTSSQTAHGPGVLAFIPVRVPPDAPLNAGYSISVNNAFVTVGDQDLPIQGQGAHLTVIGLKGDLDGDDAVTVKDAVLALRIGIGLMQPSSDQLIAVDLHKNGQITISDVTQILRGAVGLVNLGETSP
jgi:hypothetical protein